MDAELKEETADNRSGSPEPTQENPRAKLRDLPPEKDPMGAGGRRRPDRNATR
ncbi:MAG: hypothetical protein M3Q46_05030 [Verrucomicrobiota bacterium]|nr:hypothetical protein [Verrucomicrobiota bacterium]